MHVHAFLHKCKYCTIASVSYLNMYVCVSVCVPCAIGETTEEVAQCLEGLLRVLGCG